MTTSAHRPRLRAGVGILLVTSLVAAGGAAVATGHDLSKPGGAKRLHGDQSHAVRAAVDGSHARNVILLIGDGMGDSEITSARNYAFGADGRFPGIDGLPLTGQYTTFSLNKDGTPDYVTDSAASGTGWATGTKSYDGAIGVDIRGQRHRNLLELAKRKGLRTGDVTTAEIEDATPAVQLAHVTSRSCYGPVVTSTTCPGNALENGGRGSIAEQLLKTRADVTMGGGAATFDEQAKAGRYQGKSLYEQADDRGFRLVKTAAQLDDVSFANQNRPVLGLFDPGNFEVNWTGPAATPTGATTPAARCTPNPDRPATLPSLDAMTKKSISLLNRKQSKKGFFLQVEGASIDKRDHAADACGQIGETVEFDKAVQAALRFAKKDGHTTVIATADHGHTSQIVETGTNTPGLTATLKTADGAPMTLSYGTAPRAANVVGLTDQTDLFSTIADALRLG